ncbi:MAG: serine/threonine protein kinase [Candidatus Obscuribacterales bacterium]|nr:serine/threonine protein kinase [Candidatus Obscuribacterales bacterium]
MLLHPNDPNLWRTIVAILIIFFVSLLIIYLTEHRGQKTRSFRFSSDGIEFSRDCRISLLHRLKREWEDVQSIDLIEGSSARKGWWQDENDFKRGVGPILYIDFASGGVVNVNLAELSSSSKIQFFSWLEKHIPLTKFSTLAIKAKEEALSDVSSSSYTELWNDDIAMRHGSTNFMPLPCGHLLQSGRIRVISELATGGLSAVYLVEPRDRKEKLVLKESVLPLDMPPELMNKARELFHREVRLLSALNHERIAKVVDCFVERGRDYLLVEHISGRTLRQIAGGAPIVPERALELALQLSDIVAYLHSQQPPVVHRDVTPDNILVTDEDKVFLIDFGASNEFVGVATGTTVGKKSYIAPEQFRGKAQLASDLYSFGATLYFALTGKDPVALSTSTVESGSALVERLSRVVEKATELELADRYQNIGEVIADLEELEAKR